jgi:hypothetical protein
LSPSVIRCSLIVAQWLSCHLPVGLVQLEAFSFSWFSPALFPGCFLVLIAEHELLFSFHRSNQIVVTIGLLS